MEKKYSKEIMTVLENIAMSLITCESLEIRITKNSRGRVTLTTSETNIITLEN